MDHQINKNGSLTFIIENENDRYDLHQMLERCRGDQALIADMLDHFGYSGNSCLMPVSPCDVAALTEAPIVTDEMVMLDDGRNDITGRLWWYPQYERFNFIEQLLKDGSVTFSAAPETVDASQV